MVSKHLTRRKNSNSQMKSSRHFYSVLSVLLLSSFLTYSHAQNVNQRRELLNGQMIPIDTLKEAQTFWSSALQGSFSVLLSAPPVANDDFEKTMKEVPLTIAVLQNDIGDFDPGTMTKLTDPDNGSLILNSDNTFTYTSNTCFSGIDIFKYQICNIDNSVCSEATVTVTVIPPPEAVNDFVSTQMNTPITINVLENDSGEYNPASVVKVSDPGNGSVVQNSDTTFTYVPNPGYEGIDTFIYQICNEDNNSCSSATVTITIQDAPTISPTFFPTISPTYFPTLTPTAQPIETKCCNQTPLIYNAFLTSIAESISGTVTPGTPQQQALDWLLSEVGYCECDLTECKIYERYSLAVFYFSTNGDKWDKCSMPDLSKQDKIDEANAKCDIVTTPTPEALNVGLLNEGTDAWLTPVDACEWAGIVCRTSGCVDRIEFEDNKVTGSLPFELKRLLEMRFLILEKGDLSGTIPSEWGSLKELLFLDLDFNKLSGSIPDSIFTFTNMLQLDLNNNEFTGGLSTEIGLLTELIFLQMDENKFSGPLPNELGNLVNLKIGVFSKNDFTGVVSPLLGTNNMQILEADCGGKDPKVICTACTSCKK